MTIFGKLVMTGLLIVIGGGVYYGVTSYVKNDQEVAVVSPSQGTQTTDQNQAAQATTTASSTAPTGKKIPFTEFMKQGGSYKCTVTQNVANMTSEGTVYIHNTMIRGEFTTTVAGQGVSASMIARDGYTYSWTSMMPTKGYKAKIVNSEGAPGSANAGTSGTYTWDGTQIGDYSCEAWVADDTKFDLPKSIVFSDVG